MLAILSTSLSNTLDNPIPPPLLPLLALITSLLVMPPVTVVPDIVKASLSYP